MLECTGWSRHDQVIAVSYLSIITRVGEDMPLQIVLEV